MKQTESGKAFEYAIAQAISRETGAEFVKNDAMESTSGAYYKMRQTPSSLIDKAATKAVLFLIQHDTNLKQAKSVVLQPDRAGRSGDVRDVVIAVKNGELGISAKSNHAGVKHSRLSGAIDFGKEWAGHPVSPSYFKSVRPIFDSLRALRREKKLFRDVPNKGAVIYLPVLTAFEDEFKRLCLEFRGRFISRMFAYLLGKHDFYKVIKQDTDKIVTIQSMNMGGTLGWGRKWKIPNEIDTIRRKPKSNNTLLVSFTGGWLLSFRLHNASSRVEPSLKFDIQFIGMPAGVARTDIPLV